MLRVNSSSSVQRTHQSRTGPIPLSPLQSTSAVPTKHRPTPPVVSVTELRSDSPSSGAIRTMNLIIRSISDHFSCVVGNWDVIRHWATLSEKRTTYLLKIHPKNDLNCTDRICFRCSNCLLSYQQHVCKCPC